MFTVYSSNQLTALAEMLTHFQKINPNPNPFEKETILVQSTGMAQWLQMYLAQQLGIAGNYDFPFPTSFLWQQYRLLFPELPKENIFERKVTTWRLMRIIPNLLDQPECEVLRQYLSDEQSDSSQLKLFQLAGKIADLFDQYLVYRPHWLTLWEQGDIMSVLQDILKHLPHAEQAQSDILVHLKWQSLLWNTLISELKQSIDEHIFNTLHRAYLQDKYFNKLDNLTEIEKQKLPKRIFIFGISSLPATQLITLKKLSEHCDIHLFFLNPSELYWGDNVEDKVLEKLALKKQLTDEDFDLLIKEQGNKLLTMWGKQGREFLAQLVELELHHIEAFSHHEKSTNLAKLKNAILSAHNSINYAVDDCDNSIQIHACHSEIREIEVLHNHLLHLFEKYPTLSPKDIIVMSPDIDKYAPYINAVFARFEKGDKRYIPFTISDQKITTIDPIISSFMTLLSLKESQFEAEILLDLFNIVAIREKFTLSENDLYILRNWIKNAGIRAQFSVQQEKWDNYNSWENGLNRLLLGSTLKTENGIWQDTVAFDESYGLSANLVGHLSQFIFQLSEWFEFIQHAHTLEEWVTMLRQLVQQCYLDNNESADAILVLNNSINHIAEIINNAAFTEEIHLEILQALFDEHLANQQQNLHFLIGKVNFCTLLPMRAIPFKVVCLLGMNEADFPRQQAVNHFDLMQYAHQKGDRARRDDDRYLFLEAMLAAQDVFYISYIGQSIVNNKEKLPSILVSQLLDYLFEHLDAETLALLGQAKQDPQKVFLKKLVQKHTISVFSPDNFKEEAISYHKEWLAILNTPFEESNFLDQSLIIHDELPTEIELEDLIRFIQDPIKFFFNKRLGIYFENSDESIESTEHFSLSSLDNFKFKQDLLLKSEEEMDNFFTQEKLKGNLPLAHFADVYTKQLAEVTALMRPSLTPYLTESAILEIDQYIELNQSKIRLVGNIAHLFEKEIVLWKVSSVKDKDIIRLWLYYLCTLLQDNQISVKYLYLNSDKVNTLSFSPLTKEEATSQLRIYLEDYLQSYQKINYVITESINTYFNKLEKIEPKALFSYCENALYTLLDNGYSQNLYLKRVLMQTKNIDYQKVHQNTLNWFENMYNHQITI